MVFGYYFVFFKTSIIIWYIFNITICEQSRVISKHIIFAPINFHFANTKRNH